MTEIEWLKIKVECSIHQAMIRALTITNGVGYGLRISNSGLYEPDLRIGAVWPTSMLIVGMPGIRWQENPHIRTVIGIDSAIVDCFDEGFANRSRPNTPHTTSDRRMAFAYGKELLGRVKEGT